MTKKGGWYGESKRHSLAAKGIKTGNRSAKDMRGDARRVMGIEEKRKFHKRVAEVDPSQMEPDLITGEPVPPEYTTSPYTDEYFGVKEIRKSGKRYPEMNPDEPLSEKDVHLILRRVNNDKDARNDPTVQAFYMNDGGWKLTKDQQEKGRKWLSQTRNRKKMGLRELGAIENMKEITLIGTIPGERNDHQYPLYQVQGSEAKAQKFDYKVEGGELYIVG
jgi:hypothetical protein